MFEKEESKSVKKSIKKAIKKSEPEKAERKIIKVKKSHIVAEIVDYALPIWEKEGFKKV